MGVRGILLQFENCEIAGFDKNSIGYILVDKLATRIRRVACNAIEKYQTAGTLVIELFDEGNIKDYRPFGCGEETDLFTRIAKWNDITGIDILYDDDTTDSFLLPYEEPAEEDAECAPEQNIYQKSYISKQKNLYIVISKDEGIEDYFNIDDIDDPEETEMKKEMYDIGDVEYNEAPLTYETLPDFYRYVQLSEKTGPETWERDYATVVRVPDKRYGSPDGWKFIYEPNASHKSLNMPDKWQYFSDKLSAFIDKEHENDDFCIKRIKELYPMPEKPETEE